MPGADRQFSERITVRTAIVFAAVCICLMLGADIVVFRLVRWELLPDYTIFWTAGRFVLEGLNPYDAAALTAAQPWERNIDDPLAYAYPPSSLPIVAAFALLPFWPSYILWTGASVVAFWMGARRLVSNKAILLGLVTSNSLFGLVLGQTSFWTGAAIIWSLVLLDRRPMLAGILLGLAAALKPQMLMLAPLALIVAGQWRAFAGAAGGFVALVILSLPIGLWPEWFANIGKFQQIVSDYGIDIEGTTPVVLGRYLNLNAAPFQLLGAAAGVAIVWFGFRQADPKIRLVTLVCGTLLAAPHGMRYEIAMIAPVAMAGLLTGTVRGFLIAAPLFAINVWIAVPALFTAAAAALVMRKRADAVV